MSEILKTLVLELYQITFIASILYLVYSLAFFLSALYSVFAYENSAKYILTAKRKLYILISVTIFISYLI